MEMRRKVLTLTLIGLIAIFLFPVCASALEEGEEPPALMTPEADAQTYNLMPTFAWSAVSGATSFEITINGVATSKTEPNMGEEDPTPDEPASGDETNKWGERLADTEAAAMTAAIDLSPDTPVAGTNCFMYTEGDNADQTMCWYKYTPAEDLPYADITWQVKAIRAAGTANAEDIGFDSADSTSEVRNLSLFGDVSLTLAADKTAAEAGDTVTVTVSLDNMTNNSIPLDSVTFDVSFGSAFTIAESDVTATGTASEITPPVATIGATAVTVALTGAIEAGTGNIVQLVFTVAADAEANDYEFNLANCEVNSDTVVVDGPNPSNCTIETPPTVTITPSVIEGDVDGDELLTLKDAIIAEKVLTGMTLTADELTGVQAYATKHGPMGMAIVLYIFDAILMP